jgi:hypothetical protein
MEGETHIIGVTYWYYSRHTEICDIKSRVPTSQKKSTMNFNDRTLTIEET